MIFFAQTAANQSDLVVKEALRAGAENVRATASGVQFSASLETGYRFSMNHACRFHGMSISHLI